MGDDVARRPGAPAVAHGDATASCVSDVRATSTTPSTRRASHDDDVTGRPGAAVDGPTTPGANESITSCDQRVAAYRATHENDPALRIVTEGEFEPFNFLKDGKLVGWEMDYLAEVMKTIGRTYQLEARSWDGCCERSPGSAVKGLPPPAAEGKLFSDVFTGRGDLAIASISNGAVRKSVFPFSERYGFTPKAQRFIVKTERAEELSLTTHGLQVLNGKKVAVQQGTNQFFYVQDQLIGAHGLSITPKVYGTTDEATAGVASGEADVLFGSTTRRPWRTSSPRGPSSPTPPSRRSTRPASTRSGVRAQRSCSSLPSTRASRASWMP
jgi:ABC-type amino acid transport substrate-binding protein